MPGDSPAGDTSSAGGSALADAVPEWEELIRSMGLPSAAEMRAEDELYKAQREADAEAMQRCMGRFSVHISKLEKWIERKDKEDEAHRNSLNRLAALMNDSSLSPGVQELLCGESSDGDSDVGSPWDPDSGRSSIDSDSELSDQGEVEHLSCPTPLPLHRSEDTTVLLKELANRGEMQLRPLSAPPELQADYEEIVADHAGQGITDGSEGDEDADDPDESTDVESTMIVVAMKDISQPSGPSLPRISVEAAARTLSATGVPLLEYSASAVVQAGGEESELEDMLADTSTAEARPGWCPLGCPGCRLVARPRPLSLEEEDDMWDQSDGLYYYCTLCQRRSSCSHRALRHSLGHSNFLPVTGTQRCKCGVDILSTVQLHGHAVHHVMACAYSCSSCHSAAAPGPWAYLEDVRGSPWRCASCSNNAKGPASRPLPLGMIQVHEPPPRAPEPLDKSVSPILWALGLKPGRTPVGKEHSYSRKGQQARANLSKSQAQALPQQTPAPVQKRGRKQRAAAAPTDKKAAEPKANNSEHVCNAAGAWPVPSPVPSPAPSTSGIKTAKPPRWHLPQYQPQATVAACATRLEHAPRVTRKPRIKRSKSEPQLIRNPACSTSAEDEILAAMDESISPEARRSCRVRRKPQWEDYDVYGFQEEPEAEVMEKKKKKRQPKGVKKANQWHKWEVVRAADTHPGLTLRRQATSDTESQ